MSHLEDLPMVLKFNENLPVDVLAIAMSGESAGYLRSPGPADHYREGQALYRMKILHP